VTPTKGEHLPWHASILVPLINLNPFDWLGDKAKEGLADGWTAVMISLWSAGLWLLEAVFKVLDRFLTPDLTDPGLAGLHSITLWISLVVALVIGCGQVAVAAIRRDGASLGALLVGIAQYGAVTTCWVGVLAALVMASAGLTTGLLHGILDINGFAGYPAGAGWPDKVAGTVAATVLGLCSLLLLIPAGFGYILIMLVREGALLILTATAPIAAAGALGTGTRAWLWKSLRWFLAACLTAPLLALVLGLGVQITRAAFPDEPASDLGRERSSQTQPSQTQPSQTQPSQTQPSQTQPGQPTPGPSETTDPTPTDTASPKPSPAPSERASTEASQVGMAVVGAAIMVMGCFCPLALFRPLAFVDPGTASGASLRSTLQANGGLMASLSSAGGTPSAAPARPTSATQTAPDGRAESEQAADAETGNRFQAAAARALPVAGRGLAGTMRLLGGVATTSAAIGADVAGQAGIGASGYYDPSTRSARGGQRPPRSAPDDPGRRPLTTADTRDDADAASQQPPPADLTTPRAESPERGAAHDPQPKPAPSSAVSGQAGTTGLADDAVFLP
jgi:type IV secretion system protein TrbL